MGITYKVLGQVAPAATTATDLYAVGAGKQSVISTITVCNRSTAATYRIAVRPAAATLANQHYVTYDATVAANDTITLTIGMSLSATDVITVYASTANLSFSVFGSEIA